MSQRFSFAPIRSTSVVLSLLVLLTVSGAVVGQDFTSGSDGSDGALNLTIAEHGASFLFDPAGFVPPLDTNGDGIYHFTTISVEAGMTVQLSSSVLGSVPVQWLATGAVQIDGTLDLSGGDGHEWNELRAPAVAGAGGFDGGVGASSTTPFSLGLGPGASSNAANGAGHAASGSGFGPTYGNQFLLPLIGGSGGSGGDEGNESSGGGAGGGAILIAGSETITINGLIDANGGCGGNPQFGGSAQEFGGPGSSGAIRLIADAIDGTGSLRARSVNCPLLDVRNGRIRLESYNTTFNGSVPTPSLGVPGPVLPPATAPTVRITAINGVPVPANPGGVYPPADLAIDEPSTVTVDIEATYIPLFTTVEVKVQRDDGSVQVVTSTPLNGLFELSTATADIVFSPGFSTVFVQANWTP